MNVLSLFDGMSCGQIALNKLGIKYENYFASEIDKYAIEITQKNFPGTQQLGSVVDVKGEDLPKIDLLMGGSPCQGFSFAGKQLNFDDDRSKLFFEFVRLLKEVKPKYFLLENVKMKKESQEIITHYLGVEPIEICSSLVSGQTRKRLYWTNIALQKGDLFDGYKSGITQPKDKEVLLRDILEDSVDKKYYCSETFMAKMDRYKNKNRCLNNDGKAMCLIAGYHKMGRDNTYIVENESATKSGKSYCLTARYSGAVAWNSVERKQRTMIPVEVTDEENPNVYNGVRYRKLTPKECERLQTVPDGYTEGVSDTQRYRMIGNGWTIDIIAHIFSHIN